MFAMGPGFFQRASGGYATLSITGAFAAATVGVAYSSSIPISGGLEPYSLTGGTGVSSGSLDSGFSLSITGTSGARFLTLTCASPATADTMTFTASVGSTDSQTATSAQSVVVSPAVTAQYFDPAKTGSTITLSNSNKTAAGTSAGVWESAFAIDSNTEGYFEVKVDVVGSSRFNFIGVGNSSSPVNNYCGSDANGWAYGTNAVAYHSGTSSGLSLPVANNGDVVGIAVKGGKFWVAINNTWLASGNPATGASPIYSGLSGTLFPIVSINVNGQLTLRLVAGDFTYAPPAGIGAWN